MQIERITMPIVGLLAGVAGVAAYVAFGRTRRPPYEMTEEVGTFVYTYPLDFDAEAEDEQFAFEDTPTESALLDEEMNPGYQQ